jgi:hypothetical protein
MKKTTCDDPGNDTSSPNTLGGTPPKGSEGTSRIDLAKSRIETNYYGQAHVRNRILKAILNLMETFE